MKNISLDKSLSKPLYIQLYDAIVRDISDGFLPDKFKLPARRILAKQLSVSQNTVNEAYNMLADTGYIISIPKKGHFVSFNSGEFGDFHGDMDPGETFFFTPNLVVFIIFKGGSMLKLSAILSIMTELTFLIIPKRTANILCAPLSQNTYIPSAILNVLRVR